MVLPGSAAQRFSVGGWVEPDEPAPFPNGIPASTGRLKTGLQLKGYHWLNGESLFGVVYCGGLDVAIVFKNQQAVFLGGSV